MKAIERTFWDALRPMAESYVNSDGADSRVVDFASNFYEWLVEKPRYKDFSVDTGPCGGVVFLFGLTEPQVIDGEYVTHNCLLMDEIEITKYTYDATCGEYSQFTSEEDTTGIRYGTIEEACCTMLGTTEFEVNMQRVIINTLY